MQKTNEQLVALIKSGIDEADNMLQLWQQNRGFIRKMANKFKGYEDFEDLEQQGYIGLCDAVRGYRPEENVLFINYAAFWIKQSITRYIENSGNVIRIPVHSRQVHRKYKKLLQEFETHTGRMPSDKEICHYMGIDNGELENIKAVSRMEQVGSLDMHIGEDNSLTVGDLVADNTDMEESVLDEVERMELSLTLWDMVDALPDCQPGIIRARYQGKQTLKAIGDSMGISAEKVRNIESKALRRLGMGKNRRKLMPFLPEAARSIAYRHNGINEFNRTWTSSTELVALKL